MNETIITEHTLTAYNGPEFQQRLMWQLLVEPEFAEKTINQLAVEYFDDPNLKRLFIIILEYYKEFDKVPNLQNKSVHHAINLFKTPNNSMEEESLFSVVKRVELWNERILNKQMLYDGDVVQKATNMFIKQQEYRKLGEEIISKVKSGAIKNKKEVAWIEEKFQLISEIGNEEDDCEEVIEGIEHALRKEFRETIPTGVEVIDELTGGGLGKGEIGLILSPSGVGKTTLLTIIANTAYEQEKYVAQIIFEDTKDQIKRKHYTIWSGVPLSQMDEDEMNPIVKEKVYNKVEKLKGKGKLFIKKFSQEDTTIRDVRNWMTSYEKKYGFKFDILVLDYLDCLESHKRTADRNESELAIIKGFEALAADFDIPAWSAIQSNRSGFDAEFVEAHQTGGSIKRIQKSHFFMSIAKTPAQKEASLANIRIIKARFAKDGQAFNDCRFDNDRMLVQIIDDRYKFSKFSKGKKHHDSKDIDKLVDKAEKIGTQTQILVDLQDRYQDMVENETTNKNNDNIEDIESEPIDTSFENAQNEFEKTDEKVDIDALEKMMIDPEDVYDEYKSVKDELTEVGKNQNVIKGDEKK